MGTVLETKTINKHFRKPVDFHVLKDISFSVEEGEFASIMGKSGSGKSTLVHDILYAGMKPKSKGVVNAIGTLVLGIVFCWTILVIMTSRRSGVVWQTAWSRRRTLTASLRTALYSARPMLELAPALPREPC